VRSHGSHGPSDAPGCMTTLRGKRNRKKQQTKDVKVWVRREPKDEQERSLGCCSAFTMIDRHGA
jgi:hypothetical protein